MWLSKPTASFQQARPQSKDDPVDAAILLDRHPDGTTVSEPESRPPGVRSALSDIHTSFGVGIRLILPGVAIPALKFDVGHDIDVRSVAFTASRGLPRTTRPIVENSSPDGGSAGADGRLAKPP